MELQEACSNNRLLSDSLRRWVELQYLVDHNNLSSRPLLQPGVQVVRSCSLRLLRVPPLYLDKQVAVVLVPSLQAFSADSNNHSRSPNLSSPSVSRVLSASRPISPKAYSVKIQQARQQVLSLNPSLEEEELGQVVWELSQWVVASQGLMPLKVVKAMHHLQVEGSQGSRVVVNPSRFLLHQDSSNSSSHHSVPPSNSLPHQSSEVPCSNSSHRLASSQVELSSPRQHQVPHLSLEVSL